MPTGDAARVQGGGSADMSSAMDMGNAQERPETPRSAASSEMGRMDEVPPVEQWQSAPSPWAGQSESGPETTASTGKIPSPSMPPPTSGTPGTPSGGYGTGSYGSASEQPMSERADDFSAVGGPVTGGAYSSAGSADDTGIESASSPPPGDDLADKPRLSNDANDLDAQALDDNSRQEDKA